ncbi:MAG: hypothetical protein ACPGYV_09585 [Phycisphaeraceae bacterium]
MTRSPLNFFATPRTGLMLLLCVAFVCAGCKTETVVKRTWSAQKSWDVVEEGEGVSVTDFLGDANDRNRRERARVEFEREAESAANRSLPPGGLEKLLTDIKDPFAKTVASATPGLVDGASGIIVLGDFNGPDNRPLATGASGKVDKAKFINRLQLSDGVQGQWYVMAMTIDEIRRTLKDANAVPGEAVKLGQYEFIYNPANIYQMQLAVSSKPFPPQRKIIFTGIAQLIHVQSGTTVQGQGDATATYYYQPFLKDWLIESEEMRRRNAEKQIDGFGATPDKDGNYPRGHEPEPEGESSLF